MPGAVPRQLRLYHYTVTTNNFIEGTNTVSIGFHYVVTDADGIPISMPGDGIPDYLADANGDGRFALSLSSDARRRCQH